MFHKKTRPMSIKRINLMLQEFEPNYQLTQTETGEVIMEKTGECKKQVQPNLLKHLAKEGK